MSPRTRITRIYRRRAVIEDAAVRAQLRLLRDMRRGLLTRIADASGFRLFHLNQVLGAIDAEIFRGRAIAQQAATGAIGSVFKVGQDLVDRAIRSAVDVVGGLADVSPELLQAAIEVTTDQVRAVWNELGSRLKSTIRRTTLGITDPFQAVGEVAKIIRDPKTFGTAEARAEAIVRTETNRTFSMAAAQRMDQAEQRLGTTLRKAWLDAGDDRVRDAHRIAAQVYGEGGAIPTKEPFIVDGEELMFPLDPRGSAANTINCRCRLMPVVA